MPQRGYIVLFVLVLLLACAGGFFGGRLVLQRLQQDFRPRTSWAPATPLSDGSQPPAPSPSSGASSRTSPEVTMAATPSPQPLATPVATHAGGSAAGTATPETASPEPITPELTLTATETPSASPPPARPFLFDLVRPVRHTAGDCPGTYILGQITDKAGNALPDVRLRLVDEYNNQQTTATKSGADAGRFDFPIFGPPRTFYLTVVDSSGQTISPRIEIPHGSGENAQATCHWVDWQRR
jgi:hypothetical protein